MDEVFGFVPQRAISLVPSITESLFELGIQDQLIGRTDYCIYPADRVGQVPTVGGTKNPDIQKIIQMQPDMVILNTEENRLEDQQALEAAGITTWATNPRTVQEAFNLLWDIMDVFEEATHSEIVRLIERAYDFTEGAMRARRLVKVFVPIWKDPWMTFNEDTYAHDILNICGAENIFADRERQFPLKADLGESEPDEAKAINRDRRYPRITLEEVVERQPEIVLLPSEPYEFTEEHAKIFYDLDIPAAKTGNIYTVDGSLIFWHGTRIAFALRDLPPIFDKASPPIPMDDDIEE